MLILKFIIIAFCISACNKPITNNDFPTFLSAIYTNNKTLQLNFNVPITIDSIKITPSVKFIYHNNIINFYSNLEAGNIYTIEAIVRGKSKNHISFKTIIYGYNDKPAKLSFNEFSIKHDKNHSEKIELLVSEAGNLGSLVLLKGSNETDYKDFFVFPNKNVNKGDYIVLQCRNNIDIDANYLVFTDSMGLSDTREKLVLKNRLWGDELDRLEYDIKKVDKNKIEIIGASATRSVSKQANGMWRVVATKEQSFGRKNSNKLLVRNTKDVSLEVKELAKE